MWVSHSALHSHSETRMSTIKETHSPLPQKCLAMPLPNLLHTHMHEYKHKNTHTQLKSGQHVQSGHLKPLCPGERVATMSLSIYWVERGFLKTLIVPRTFQVSFISRVTCQCWKAATTLQQQMFIHLDHLSYSSATEKYLLYIVPVLQ